MNKLALAVSSVLIVPVMVVALLAIILVCIIAWPFVPVFVYLTDAKICRTQ